MLITKDFVMLNLPKTGTTFARKVIKKAYKKNAGPLERLKRKLGVGGEWVQEMLLYSAESRVMHQHGKRRDIPQEHNKKKILTITRNPLDRYLSQYKFGWWKDNLDISLAEVKINYPHFPELSFSEFYYFLHQYVLKPRLAAVGLSDLNIGYQTWQFFDFYFDDPSFAAIKIIKERDFSVLDALNNVYFLKQERLSIDLVNFLVDEVGFNKKKIKFIAGYKKINVSPAVIEQQIPAEIVALIMVRDQFLFSMFPEYRNGLD